MEPTAYFANPPTSGALATIQPTAVIAGEEGDYAWTHSATVEGFFAVLTVVIIPVAGLRWLRRLHIMPSARRGGLVRF